MPATTQLNIGHLRLADSKLRGDKRLATRSPECTDFSDLGNGKFGAAILHTPAPKVRVAKVASEAGSVGMGMVFTASDPFKVARGVVRLVAIEMIHLVPTFGWCWEKRTGNKPMNHKSPWPSPTNLKGYPMVAAPNNLVLEHPAQLCSASHLSPAYRAKVRDLVKVLIARNRTPFFRECAI